MVNLNDRLLFIVRKTIEILTFLVNLCYPSPGQDLPHLLADSVITYRIQY